MLDQSTLEGRVIAAAMRLAAERPWGEVTLLDIAESAGTTLVEIKPLFSTKAQIIAAFLAEIDDEVLRRAPKRDTAQAPRDTVFEIVMSRFDVLEPYKSALRSIMRSPSLDPEVVKAHVRAQHWMLTAAGIDTSGPKGMLRIGGLSSIYASVFRVWMEDDDPGLARTMAALDRRLRSGERTLSTLDDMAGAVERFGQMFKRSRSRTNEASPPPPPSAGTEPPMAV